MKTIKDIEREIEIFISASHDKKSSEFQKQLKFYREAKSLVSSVPADMIQAQLIRHQEKLKREHENISPIEYSIELMEFVLEPVNVI